MSTKGRIIGIVLVIGAALYAAAHPHSAAYYVIKFFTLPIP